MNTVRPSRLLKTALLADAAVSGATGLLQLSAAAPLATMLELPRAALLATGEFFVLYALGLVVMASRERLWSWPVGFIVLGNAAWGMVCVALLLAGVLAPNALGAGFVLVQAAAVGLFAALEWRGLRSSPPAGALPRTALS